MIDSLRHLLLIVEHGTFTEAARRAHLTQPALSASIRRLEDALGARLLHRGSQGARPTAEGEAYLPHARAALAALADGRSAVRQVAGLDTGSVRLGAGPTAVTYLLPARLAAFRQLHPGVRFYLTEAHTPTIWDALAAGRIDMGLVSARSSEGQGSWFVREPCIEDQLIVIAAPGAEASPRSGPEARENVDALEPSEPARVPPARCATTAQDWVSFPRGSTLRAVLDEAFDRPEVVMELFSIAGIKGNVRAGIGRSLVSRAAVAHDLAEGRLVEVPTPVTPIARTLILVHRGVDRLSPAAARLRTLLLTDRASG